MGTMGNGKSSAMKMRAVVRGGGGQLNYVEDWDTPGAPGAGQVLLKVSAAGINPVDYKAPASIVGKVVGLDVCGRVEAVGEGVDFKVGDCVYGTARGTLA